MNEKLKVEYIPIDDLKTYENNAKLHPAEQIEQIKKSIQEFGMNDPIAVWKDNVIIEGHGRLIALKELGYETVPVIRLDELTDEQRRAYALVHNKLTMNSDFDFSILDMELEDLKEFDFDMEQYGFEFQENVEEEIKEPKEAEYYEKISIVIDCKDENEAEQIYNELVEKGYKCRISTL